jgi:hypothetical protein
LLSYQPSFEGFCIKFLSQCNLTLYSYLEQKITHMRSRDRIEIMSQILEAAAHTTVTTCSYRMILIIITTILLQRSNLFTINLQRVNFPRPQPCYLQSFLLSLKLICFLILPSLTKQVVAHGTRNNCWLSIYDLIIVSAASI